MAKADSESIRLALAAMIDSDDFKDIHQGIYVEKGDLEGPVRHPIEIHPSGRWAPQVFPCVELVPIRARRQNPDDYRADSIYDIDCYYHNQGADEERLQVEVERFMRAVEDFILDRPNLIAQTVEGAAVWTGDINYSPLTKFTGSETVLRSGLISIFVRAQR